MAFRCGPARLLLGAVAKLSFYLCCGLAYWVITLAAHGEPENVRTLPPIARLRVHAMALLLSMLIWPVAIVRLMSR